MRRWCLAFVLVAAVLPTASSPLALAKIGGWASGDQRYFIIDRICRDGMSYRALDSAANPTPGATGSIDLGARFYTAPGTFDIPNSQDYNPEQRYGELLSPITNYPLTYHPDPLPDPPNPGDTYYIYGSGTILWPRLLTAGTDRVVVTHKQNAWLWDTVQDCQLNPTSVLEGGSVTLGHANLPFDPRMAPATALRYTLTTLPTGGTLALNGAPVAVGAQFTQADIDAGRLRYSHGGGEAPSDSFGYTVRAITRVSIATDGTQANAAAVTAALSADASAVAFASAASNLVSGDGNGVQDIFVRRTSMLQTERVSVTTGGAQANGPSAAPAIGYDGSAVAFESLATNLEGSCSPAINRRDIYLRTTTTVRVSQPSGTSNVCTENNGDSFRPTVSVTPDQFGFVGTPSIAFSSDASTLSGGTDTNTKRDIFGPVSYAGGLQQLSQTPDGSQATDTSDTPSLSFANTRVAFESDADNLSASDSNAVRNIFARNTSSIGSLELVSVGVGGTAANGDSSAASAAENLVAFASSANNLVNGDSNGVQDVFVRNTGASTTARVSVSSGGAQADGASYHPALALFGRFVAFSSDATNLVAGDTNGKRDIFVRDLARNTTTRVSLGDGGVEPNDASRNATVSADGSYIAFESDATNLVPADTNGTTDIFLVYTGYSSQFKITVTPVNDPPTLDPIAGQYARPGQALGPIALGLADVDTAAGSLTLSATSSDLALLPTSGLTFGGSGSARTLSIAAVTLPAGRTSADVTITLTLSDGTTTVRRSFILTVGQRRTLLPAVRR